MQRVLIIGATSAIAEACARQLAANGARLHLLARDQARLGQIADDLRVRGAAAVNAATLDVDRSEHHGAALDAAFAAFDGFDLILVCHGSLPDELSCSADDAALLAAFHTNATATLLLMNACSRRLRPTGAGTLAVISSVAGDRGRGSNAAYGSAKAAVSAYASGLRQRLHGSGVNVLTIKPGFVDTPMTRDFRKGALWAKPDAIASGILRAAERRRSVAYLPAFWWPLMRVITHLPEWLFRRLPL
jgi:decaprenylphospho-beta-D-erythro-pentofuranosid-2-ulose 2-reductase